MAIFGKHGIIKGTKIKNKEVPIKAPLPKLPEPVILEYTEQQINETRNHWVGKGVHTIDVKYKSGGLDYFKSIAFNTVGVAMGCGLLQIYNITSLLQIVTSLDASKNEVAIKDIQDKFFKILSEFKNDAGSFLITLGDNYKVYRPILEKWFNAKPLTTYPNLKHNKDYMQTLYIITL